MARLRQKDMKFCPRRGLGHYLKSSLDILLPKDLAEATGGKWQVLFRRELPSTQDVARRLAAEEVGEGTMVLAERQTAGQGRMRGVVSPLPGASTSPLS